MQNENQKALKNFVTIYRWQVIREQTPWNVQVFRENRCEAHQDFATHLEAKVWAESHDLPIIYTARK